MPIKQIGLTGNIGSGKSTVASLLKDMSIFIIDADALAKDATKDPVVLQQIQTQLGKGFLQYGQLDRLAIAKKVFDDKNALKTLNGIIHPWVAQKRKAIVASLEASENPPTIIVQDIPLLYETRLEKDFDLVIVVYASLKTRIERVSLRSNLTKQEILLRDAQQLPLEEKVNRADIVINNTGNLESLREEVRLKLHSLKNYPDHKP